MKKSYILILALCGMAFVGCVNDDYDLTDIDTTAQFNVEDLVIPVNIDQITLKSVIDLKDSSKIKEVTVGGKNIYALVEDGEFESSTIKVKEFKTKAPNINPIKSKLDLTETEAGVKARDGEAVTDEPVAYYKLSNDSTQFKVSADQIHKAVKAFESAKVDAEFNIELDVSELTKTLNRIHCENVKLQIIKGLSISKLYFGAKEVDIDYYSYDTYTGELDFSKLDLEFTNGKFQFRATIDGIYAAIAGIDFDASNHKLDFGGVCKILDGEVAIYQKDIDSSTSAKARNGRKGSAVGKLPSSINFTGAFKLSEIKMEDFSGDFEYDIENLNINPVQLTDIPDIFNQKGTDIRLKNPQLYLSIHNPLAEEYEIEAEAGLKLTSVNGDTKKTYEADEKMTLDKAYEYILLSPSETGAAYEHTKYVPFTNFGNILSGDGIPKTINIDIVEPKAPLQSVKDFRLGEEIEPVTGTYEVLVPFELANGSKVLYNDTIKGWNDEDLDNLTITKLGLGMKVTTDIALDMTLRVYPLVINSKGVAVKKTDVYGEAVIKASAQGQALQVSMNGKIERLDGLVFEATLKGVQDSKALAPLSSITLDNLKATVSGHYDKEL